MQISRRRSLKGLTLATALAMGGSFANAQVSNPGSGQDFRVDKVFTSTNSPLGNEVLVFGRGVNGQPTALLARVGTQGTGSGGALLNQGGVTLSGDGKWLFVINYRSSTVSTFAVEAGRLSLKSVVRSGEGFPLSVTESGDVVYVLNENPEGSLQGFRNQNGQLTPIPATFRQLSSGAGGSIPTQVNFSPDGRVLIANSRRFNTVFSYRVNTEGVTDALLVALAQAPGGHVFDRLGRLLMTETFSNAPGRGAVSFFRFSPGDPARPVLVGASVGNNQTGTARIDVAPNGRNAYTTNTASNTISRYAIRSGRLVLARAVAANTGAAPTDLAVAPTGRSLWVLNSGSQTLSAFAIDPDGRLTLSGEAVGLPFGANGLAAN